MYSPFTLARKFLHYYFRSYNSKGHGMHSPFVYDLIRSVLNDRKRYPEYAQIEAIRTALKKDHTILSVQDLGAGSVHGSSSQRSVGSIARHAAKPPKYAQLLFRLARYYHPDTILELGTSLGISTRYLTLGHPAAKMITLEGVPSIADWTGKVLNRESLPVTLQQGNFDDTLAGALQDLGIVGLSFVDGNHRKEPTLRYFQQILPHTTETSIIIFDDIHWSAEMEQAWAEICAHEAVRCSIDLFFVGIVFFRPEFREKQHFSIRF